MRCRLPRSLQGQAQPGKLRPLLREACLFLAAGVAAGVPAFDGPFRAGSKQPAQGRAPLALIGGHSCGRRALTPPAGALITGLASSHHQIGQEGRKPWPLFGSETCQRSRRTSAASGLRSGSIRAKRNPPELARTVQPPADPAHTGRRINRRELRTLVSPPVGVHR